MKVQSRRCVYCTLLIEETSFTSYVAPDGKRIVEQFHKQCEITVWPALIREYPQLRSLRDVLFELSKRAEPAAPSKAWDNNIRTPLREGQKPDGVTLDGRTLNTAANSRSDRGSQIWVGRKLTELVADVEKRIYPDPSASKIRVERPRCQKGSCNSRGEVGKKFCGDCGEPYSTKPKMAVGVARDD